MTVRLSLPSENTGSERLTGSLIASSARAISCRGMPREAAISSSVGSRPVSAVSFSRACRILYAVSRMLRDTRRALLSRRYRRISPAIIGTP